MLITIFKPLLPLDFRLISVLPIFEFIVFIYLNIDDKNHFLEYFLARIMKICAKTMIKV